MDVEERSVVHSALGDESRLRLVDLLFTGDLTVRELGNALEMPGNLLAHHLNVLQDAGVIVRHDSESDRRKRYVILRRDVLDALMPAGDTFSGSVVFVCSHNSARSQYAAAYWFAATGEMAVSAGSHPSPHVHPTAIRVAAERGIDLSAAVPRGYESITSVPDLVISVCDRAGEEPLPEGLRQLHWSIPDPVLVGKVAAFRSAFTDLERRVDRLIA
jgi:ArsR family transcriptional regulator, arsenate/arsenite/antimonite-responsive transcriptional repressor / arsenate reductase (thioredoxin)